MIFTSAKRVIKTGFINFWRNGFLSLAAVITITLSLLAFGTLIFANAFGQTLVEQIKNKKHIPKYYYQT